MSTTGTRSITWSHGEDQFCLSKIGLILELEERCKAGIATILTRLANGNWGINDVRETIRLGLIGGGMSADAAMSAVRNHVDEAPNGVAPCALVAYAIIEAVLVGVPGDEVGKAEPEATKNPGSTTTMGASVDQK